MSLLTAKYGSALRRLLPYAAALPLSILLGAAIAYSGALAGDRGRLLLVLVVLAAVFAFVVLVEWRIGVIALFGLLPYESVINFGTFASGTKALALLTFFSLGLTLLRSPELPARFARLWREPLTLAALAFAVWAASSVSWALRPEVALPKVTTFAGVCGLMLAVALLDHRSLPWAWGAALLGAAASVPLGYVLPKGEKMLEVGRFSPGGADPNAYACLLVVVFFVAYFGFRHRRMAVLLLTPVLFYGVFATQSRTALVVLVATPLAGLLVPRLAAWLGGRTLLLYALGATAFAGVVLLLPAVGGALIERYATLAEVQSEQTWSGRWSIWMGALQVISAHPLLGVGAGNFAYAAIDYSTMIAAFSAERGEFAGVAHNMFLSVASQLGLVGLALFLGTLALASGMAARLAQEEDLGVGLALGLIAFAVTGMSLTWEFEKIGYVLLGSLLSLRISRPEEDGA
ncbi:hypothetical protein Rxycam_00888 [Rubrobacter xylanophilus DSM 9941]|uniref:O-antigen ligase family protein n=1 Tax=Rubrobacter xylanophilus TaxID=49319 RepID=UPI001C63C796|nr:O-antigen ligase family protein [Rubrobacter xylanophilus]QYJ15076.1 hypothetical protein Rxycam_00888 [Rubrobacter xylanophilus DSM 9941]